jgi:acetoacetyl-CoA synthetase
MEPVYARELQNQCLGMKMESFDEDGKPAQNKQGELSYLAASPSMPIHFWEDPKGKKYRGAYFDVYPGIWQHGTGIS